MANTAKLSIRPRAAQWGALRKTAGLDTDDKLADAMGVPQSSVTRVMNGTVDPSARFIAQALGAFPFAGFRELFQVCAR